MFLRTEIRYRLLQNCIRGPTVPIYPKDIKNIVILPISMEKQEHIKALLKESEKLKEE
jgi:hypothetical protein